MKTCPNCGNQISDDAAFCNNCGVSVAAAPQQAPVSQAAPVAEQQAPQQNFGQMPYQQPLMYNDPKDHTNEFDAKDIADNKIVGAAAYLFGVLGVIMAFVVGSPYARFHARNTLRISIAAILVMIPAIIPFLGWIVTGICLAVLGIIKIIAIVWAFMGKAKDLPILSDIGFLK